MEKKATHEVEFLLAYEDNTWDTVKERIPVSVRPEEWAQRMAGQVRYRRVVLIAVYSIGPEEE